MPRSHSSQSILFFSHAAEFGGAEKSLLNVILEARNQGYSVSVVVPNEGPFIAALRQKKVPVSIVEYAWWCNQEKVPLHNLVTRTVKSVWRVLAFAGFTLKRKPDLIISNTLTIPWGLLLGWVLNRPHIHFIREFGTLDFNFRFWLGYKRAMELISKYSAYVFTNSEATFRHFRRYIEPQKLDFFYPQITALSQVKLSSHPHYFAEGVKLKLAALGTIMPGKGQLDIVRALTRLVKSSPNLSVQLIIAGKVVSEFYHRQLQGAIKADPQVAQRVKLLPFVDNPHQLLHEADAVVISSRQEAFGRVASEAAAMKKAIIATDAGAHKDRVRDGESGLLYPVGDDNALAEQIEVLYYHPQLRYKLGEAAYNEYTFMMDEDMTEKLWKVIAAIKAD